MRYSNLHTHSTFSDGKSSLEENVRSALEKNMLSLGFSDHSFTPCDTSYCLPETRFGEYLAEIARLKEKYGDQIPLYAGLELDYYTEMDTSMLDYVIASVHYIVIDGVCHPIDHSLKQQQDCAAQAFGGDVLAMAQRYYDILTEHVKRTRPTLVGHFDVITKFGFMPEESPAYRQMAVAALKEIIPVCPYIEMNTGAISRGVRSLPYPASYLLDTIRENGGEIVLSSDSHHRDNLICCFDTCVEMLKKAGFDHISVFNGSGYTRQAI